MKEITFSYKAPEALRVMLIGDFTNWQREPIPLNKRPDGVWQVRVRLGAGTHTYSFVVDEKWREDGECHVRVPRAPIAFCGEN
jgi:1,4-alpha-glucan branching enzyme